MEQMDNPAQWGAVRKALENLETLMECTICKRPFDDPCFITVCYHIFCRKCVPISRCQCPKCKLPFYPRDVWASKQVQTTQIHCELMRLILGLPRVNTKIDLDNLPEDLLNHNALTSKEAPQSLLEKSSTEDNSSKNSKEFVNPNETAKTATTRKSRRHSTPTSTTLTSPKTPSSQVLKRNSLGETALHTSAIKGNIDAARQLLQQGSNPNVKDNAGWSPLHEACNHGHTEIASLLLDNGAIVNMAGMDCVTPLHDAVANNHAEVAALLLQRGADVQLKNINGLTPRDLANSREMRRVLETTFPVVAEKPNIAPVTQNLIILTSGLNCAQEDKTKKCAKLLGVDVVKEFSDKVTHIVVACNETGACTRTLKYLTGIITGKWILTFEWIEQCFVAKSLRDESDFEITECTANLKSGGPKRGRINQQLQHPGLFSGCQFYFRGDFSSPYPPKKHLENLVRKGQGIVLSREPKLIIEDSRMVPFHAQPNSNISDCMYFIIYTGNDAPHSKNNAEGIRYLPVNWLLDCMACFQILGPNESHV